MTMNFPNHSDCTRCPLHEEAKTVGHATLWLEDSRPPSPSADALVWLGQNPGYHEDKLGTPFIGRSGILLRGGFLDFSGAPVIDRPARPGATFARPRPTPKILFLICRLNPMNRSNVRFNQKNNLP